MKSAFFISLIILSANCYSQTVNDLRPTVTMKEYVDMQAGLNQKILEVQIKNINDNVSKANETMDKRLDGMNEFRDTLKDANATFITRSELIAYIGMLAGLFFGWSNYMKNKKDSDRKEPEGRAIAKN
jgi:hypothetical protein